MVVEVRAKGLALEVIEPRAEVAEEVGDGGVVVVPILVVRCVPGVESSCGSDGSGLGSKRVSE